VKNLTRFEVKRTRTHHNEAVISTVDELHYVTVAVFNFWAHNLKLFIFGNMAKQQAFGASNHNFLFSRSKSQLVYITSLAYLEGMRDLSLISNKFNDVHVAINLSDQKPFGCNVDQRKDIGLLRLNCTYSFM
jgi:hypothetical protein